MGRLLLLTAESYVCHRGVRQMVQCLSLRVESLTSFAVCWSVDAVADVMCAATPSGLEVSAKYKLFVAGRVFPSPRL